MFVASSGAASSILRPRAAPVDFHIGEEIQASMDEAPSDAAPSASAPVAVSDTFWIACA